MNQGLPKQKTSKRRWLLLIFGIIILIFAYFFFKDVLTIRNQILSGDYNLEQYGKETSGSGGSNLSSQIFSMATSDDPFIGTENAAVTIVEFGDFECPFCRQAFPIIRSLAVRYQDKIKFIYRDFPLSDVHPQAQIAAQAGYCAHQQNLFWPLHDKIFQNQDLLSRDYLFILAEQVGLDSSSFKSCLDSAAALQEVKRDLTDGLDAGVAGTPTWFINGVRVAGVIPEKVFEQIIEDLIK